MQPLSFHSKFRGGRAGRRLAGVLGLTLVLAVISGDRASSAAIDRGIDPLEVLDLYVRPNVLVVLDSSGSMTGTVQTADALSGDHPRSRLFQAKQIVRDVVQDNQSKVNFQFGTYTQQGSNFQRTGAGSDRFYYTTSTRNLSGSPAGDATRHDESMEDYEITILGEPNRLAGYAGTCPAGSPSTADCTLDNGFQAWQDIAPAWNTLYFEENATVITAPQVDITAANRRIYFNEQIQTTLPYQWIQCYIDLPVGTYSTNAELDALGAAATAMLVPGLAPAGRTCVFRRSDGNPPNGQTGAVANTTGTYQLVRVGTFPTAQLRFQRSAGARRWQLLRPSEAQSALPEMGFTTGFPASVPGGGGTFNSTTNWSNANTGLTGGALGSSTTVAVPCDAVVTPTRTFYRDGVTLAAAIQAAMNGSCVAARQGADPAANSYNVAYNVATGQFTFSRAAGTHTWRVVWNAVSGVVRSTIRGALGMPTGGATAFQSTGSLTTGEGLTLLRRRPSTRNSPWRFTETVDPDGAGGTPADDLVSYQATAGKLWNGETLTVAADGTICDLQYAATPTVPAEFYVQRVSACGGANQGGLVTFKFAGGEWSGNNVSCNGMAEAAGLVPCDQAPGNFQLDRISPYVDRELPFNPDGTLKGYYESPYGDFGVITSGAQAFQPATSAKADGYTPIANSLIDIKNNFNLLWSTGQVACPAGPPSPSTSKFDVLHCPDRDGNSVSDPGYTRLALDAISTHVNPKERTIVLFVTDGDDTCQSAGTSGGATASNARRAAYHAQVAYQRIVASDPASSVQTYVIGFGNGATPALLNLVAWGGSGLVASAGELTAYGGTFRWVDSFPSAGQLSTCKSSGGCQDAFIAPDAATLKSFLQGIINQGVTTGEFVAQTPLFNNIYERVATFGGNAPNGEPYDPRNPETRYAGVVPTLFQNSFILPGFKGQFNAYVNQAGAAVSVWNAGQKLTASVSAGHASACPANAVVGNLAGECRFGDLHGGATDQNVGSSAAAIKRRVYTTSRNGTFTVTAQNLVDPAWIRTQGGTGDRLALWPPAPTVAPNSNSALGALDGPLGLPTAATLTAADFTNLQTNYKACRGTPALPATCSGSDDTKAKRARREVREMALAFMAGAEWIPDANGDPKRSLAGDVLFKARDWVLADGTFGTPAIASVATDGEPGEHTTEYRFYRDGGKISGAKQPGLLQGFGLSHPDKDDTLCPPGGGCQNDNRATLKPNMTVVYFPANDMLHAFRAGCSNPTLPTCDAAGDAGQELWGFVPYDQLGGLDDRLLNRPPRRKPHDYMISASVRFADVFVPSSTNLDALTSPVGVTGLGGVWRRLIVFGRGHGGKYLTGLDVTAPGPYTTATFDTVPPIALWNRGNPDTQDGSVGGTPNNTAGDVEAFKLMGETWSTPTISWANRFGTTRRPCNDGTHGDSATGVAQVCTDQSSAGVEFVSFVGSGFGEDGTREGYALFTLDTLTGDIVAYGDVEAMAASVGWDRTGGSYPGYRNAVISSPSSYNVSQVGSPTGTGHPASVRSVRVYVGDLHGRLWKIVTAAPHVVIPFADLGADQPIGVSAALIRPGLGTFQGLPHVYVISGNDTRALGPFKLFGLYDEKSSDTDTLPPAANPLLFSRTLNPPDAGTSSFRGTLAPLTFFNAAFEARVAFGATRFNPPDSPDAPAVPPYPCRSSFDSILYGLKADSGDAAYNLPVDGGAAQFIPDARILALTPVPDPVGGTSKIDYVKGQTTSIPPPPAPGQAPSSPVGAVSVSTDQAAPAGLLFRNATTVCN